MLFSFYLAFSEPLIWSDFILSFVIALVITPLTLSDLLPHFWSSSSSFQFLRMNLLDALSFTLNLFFCLPVLRLERWLDLPLELTLLVIFLMKHKLVFNSKTFDRRLKSPSLRWVMCVFFRAWWDGLGVW